MKHLLPFTLTALWCSLKPTVTALLQCPLQRCSALARAGDTLTRFTPPITLRPLTYARCGMPARGSASQTLSAVQHVLTGCLLLGLSLLTLLNLPLETAMAHDEDSQTRVYPPPDYQPEGLGPVPIHGTRRHYDWVSINWIRVHKNPKITPATELTSLARKTFWPLTDHRPVYDFTSKGFQNRNTLLLPSRGVRYNDMEENWGSEAPFWVDFDPVTGALPEPGPNGGLITATENTVARVGDRVAIAINVNNENGGGITPDISIGPKIGLRAISFNAYETVVRGLGGYESKRAEDLDDSREIDTFRWRLNPNMPLANFVAYHQNIGTDRLFPSYQTEDTDDRKVFTGTREAGANHTLIYQFVVTAAHVKLNESEWLRKGSYAPDKVAPFNVVDGGNNHRGFFRYWAENPDDSTTWKGTVRREEHIDLDPPVFDATASPIYYPKIVDPETATPATAEIDVPTGTQTGVFTVTLRFYETFEGSAMTIFEDHGAGSEFFEAFKTKLGAGVSDGTVVSIERVVPEDAAQLRAATRYRVMVVPALGFVGEMSIQVPANTVADTSGTGNRESDSVTVPVSTPLQLVAGRSIEVVEPESGVYLAGDALTVEVPFETDGLTYEGEHPPYVTIYLGAREPANARHAAWQKGSERSGSTIVPFVYVLQASDPLAETVTVDVNSLSIPRETTLMAASGLERAGTADLAMGAGEVAPVPAASVVSITDASGERPVSPTSDVPVLPVIYLPETSDPKADASAVPRSPIVFNELGNGSEAANDWLELRNVTGSDVSLKDWELSVVADGKKEDTSLIVFPDVNVPANGLLLITNSASDKTPLAGGEKKGLSHASLVDAGLSLPDDGKFLLILRNTKEKLGLDEAFVDVAGGGGSDTDAFVREQEGPYDTHVWPLQVLAAPGDNTEDALSAGKVWQRAKADIVGYHKDAWGEAVFTGLGYDRMVSKSAATAGTPGYPNDAVKTEAATPRGAVTFSEIMFDSDGGTLPQWIELYNNSKTEALNLNRWQLEIQNRDSEDLVGRPIVRLTLQEKVIQPNQTLLIVTGDARASSADVFPADRVYNLLKLHEKNLRIKKPQDTFLSAEGFYLKLSDRNGTKIDEIGNLDDNRRTDDAPAWVLPVSGMDGARSSLVRRYAKGVAEKGTERAGWAFAANFKQFKHAELHYGHVNDIGTPGYRQGGALPVELSSFTVTCTEAGAVIVTWTTESEVDNAGFNLRRSLTRDSGFTLLNPVLIAGAGTTGERQTYTFTDTSAKPGVEYYYQIEEVSLGGLPETLRTRRLPGPVSPANRALTTFGEVKQRE